MLDVVQREIIYIGYYFMVQLRQIFFYWVLGMVIGSLVSVFAKDAIHSLFGGLKDKKMGIWGVIPASLLGIASPLCMYGTIPIAASFSRQGMRDDWLAAFMLYSTALGGTVLAVRSISCILCGIGAGLAVHFFFGKRAFFNFDGFAPGKSHDTDPNPFLRFLKNLGRNIRATGLYFLVGVLLSALFQRYVPADAFAGLFGEENEGFGLLLAATIGVPLYACGGGTIPLLQQWLSSGMSMGAAASFMITGPATKITNLGELKSVLGIRYFVMYLGFVILFSLVTGAVVNLVV